MKKPQLPKNESERLEALFKYQVLDTEAEPIFDSLVKLAASVCGTKIALVSLVDRERQWFKAKFGIDAIETPRDVSYCGHAILNDEVMVVEDAKLDDRFFDNPLLTGEPHVRFYAGAPLVTPDGFKIGTLCVIDSEVKKLSTEQVQVLKDLSRHCIDVLEQRLLLKNSEFTNEQAKDIQEISKTGGWLLDVKTQKTLWTSEIYKIYGYDDEIPTNVELGLSNYLPHEQEKLKGLLKEVLEKQKAFDVDLQFIDVKGRAKWVRSIGRPVVNDSGEVAFIKGVFQDITEKKQKELILEETKTYLDLALTGANLGVWDWFLTDNSVRFDKRWAEMLGLDFNTLKMELSTWQDRVHPDDLADCFKDIQAHLKGETEFYKNVHRMKHLDGHWVYILDQGKISERDTLGNPVRFTGTHLDITQLERGKKKISLLYERSPLGFAFCDMQGKLLEFNQKYLDITGYAKDELLQLSYWDLTPVEYKQEEEKILKQLTEKGFYNNYRKKYKQKNGSLIDVELSGFIVEDFDGKKGIWSLIEDITERKQMEDKAKEHAKFASLGQLAAGVGHEINNPLAIIRGYLIKMKKTLPEDLFKQNLGVLEMIEKMDYAVDRIENIVKGLRTYSRQDEKNLVPFFIKDRIEDTLWMLKEIYQGLGISLDLYLKGDFSAAKVLGSAGKLQQILVNLLANAKDAVEKSENKKIELVLEYKRAGLQLTVKDSGCGMTEEVKARIFDPFYTTKEINKGTGIGLSLVQNFVQDMRGEIGVNSALGKGSEFIIWLPLYEESQLKGLAGKTNGTGPLSKKESIQETETDFSNLRVLIVDDELIILEMLSDVLRAMGFYVQTVSLPSMAIKILAKNPFNFDILITDLYMPEMSGIDLVERIHVMGIKKLKKFIASGGVDLEESMKSLMDEGLLDGLLLKPFDETQIREIFLAKGLLWSKKKKAS